MQFPVEFIESVRPLLGDETEAFLEALGGEPSVSIRINPKCGEEFLAPELQPVLWCEHGFYLPSRPQFTLDPMLHAGAYYVQEASSMFLWQALKQYAEPHWSVLDMCAAPGGKSTLINSFLSDEGFLVCNEFVPQRANILAENISKLGRANTLVTNNAPVHFERYAEVFDAVVVDAPCSGEGMFRKDDTAVSEWSLRNVDKCVDRQREILTSAWAALKPGGVLVYSTCTFNVLENEENIRWMINEMDAEFMPLRVEDNWLITATDCGYRFLPHKTRGEGLFLSVVCKPGELAEDKKFKLPKHLPEKNDALLKWIDSENFTTLSHKNVFYAVAKDRYSMVLSMLQNLNVLQFGVPLAVVKGRDFVPCHGLALSSMLNREQFSFYELDYERAITYLRAETLSLPDAPHGFIIVTYRNMPLGFVKNVGNRCNNFYPSEWRIRKLRTDGETVHVL